MRKITLMSITPSMPLDTLDSIIKVSSNKTIVADGPLSLEYTKALNQIYAKEIDKETGISLETQANDVIVEQNIWEAAYKVRQELTDIGEGLGLVYGVQGTDANIDDVINVSTALSTMTEEEKSNSSIIIDFKVTPDNEGNLISRIDLVNPFAEALESLAKGAKVPVFISLESYIDSLKG